VSGALIEIEIPPRRGYVGVVRLALGALGRAESVEEGLLDDLRIAVSEACATAVVSSEAAGSDAPIRVAWRAEPEAMIVDVYDPAPRPDDGDEDPTATGAIRLDLSESLLRSLVDDIELTELDEGGRRTRLTLNR
jgi:serine/threonine-protein kinase RsbW